MMNTMTAVLGGVNMTKTPKNIIQKQSQTGKTERAIHWELKVCKILESSKCPQIALLDLPEMYRWSGYHDF